MSTLDENNHGFLGTPQVGIVIILQYVFFLKEPPQLNSRLAKGVYKSRVDITHQIPWISVWMIVIFYHTI